jgi:hypothetical protein
MVVPPYDPPPLRSFDFGRYHWSNSSKLHGRVAKSQQKPCSDTVPAYAHVRFRVEILRPGMQWLCSASVRLQLRCGDKSPPTSILMWRSLRGGSEHKEIIEFYKCVTTTSSAILYFATYFNHSFRSVDWCTQHMPTSLNTLNKILSTGLGVLTFEFHNLV